MIGNVGNAKDVEENRWNDDDILLIVLHLCAVSAVLQEPLQGADIELIPLDGLHPFIKFKVQYGKVVLIVIHAKSGVWQRRSLGFDGVYGHFGCQLDTRHLSQTVKESLLQARDSPVRDPWALDPL
jgi:hypothetical protein